jgi:malonate-semialdehyde dehydrogenase (acetylating)/methylmalonate-semialdehyde dehydrogenase
LENVSADIDTCSIWQPLDLAGMHIFSGASAKGKRVQCNMETKNHDVVMQDVDLEATLNTFVGAAF